MKLDPNAVCQHGSQRRKCPHCENNALEAINADLLAALEQMLIAFSVETDFGIDASTKRLAAKKQARTAIARSKGQS